MFKQSTIGGKHRRCKWVGGVLRMSILQHSIYSKALQQTLIEETDEDLDRPYMA